jgi:hypothetical protein
LTGLVSGATGTSANEGGSPFADGRLLFGNSTKFSTSKLAANARGSRGVTSMLTRKSRRARVDSTEAAAAAAAAAVPTDVGDEISVMNNYFGIGLDAKVALDFDTFRNKNPQKCRSRMKNQMWCVTASLHYYVTVTASLRLLYLLISFPFCKYCVLGARGSPSFVLLLVQQFCCLF